MSLTFAFDLDGTLCRTEGMEYAQAEPIPERIQLVNALHEAGHYIIIHTARGQSMHLAARRSLFSMTRRQLNRWGLRYHELLEKPWANFYVDDRAVACMDFFMNVHQLMEEELRHG